MTLDKAKQKILDHVLATTEGWCESSQRSRKTGDTYFLVHDSLPEMLLSYLEGDEGYSESVSRLFVDGRAVIEGRGKSHPLCQLAQNASIQAVLHTDHLFESRLIQIAESLP